MDWSDGRGRYGLIEGAADAARARAGAPPLEAERLVDAVSRRAVRWWTTGGLAGGELDAEREVLEEVGTRWFIDAVEVSLLDLRLLRPRPDVSIRALSRADLRRLVDVVRRGVGPAAGAGGRRILVQVDEWLDPDHVFLERFRKALVPGDGMLWLRCARGGACRATLVGARQGRAH